MRSPPAFYYSRVLSHAVCSDLDFEYPSTTALGQGFADLISALRTAFNSLASRKGDSTPYLVTAAVPAGAANYAFLNVAQMNAGLSYWNLMVCLSHPSSNSYIGV